jgi:hypothetical protein
MKKLIQSVETGQVQAEVNYYRQLAGKNKTEVST